MWITELMMRLTGHTRLTLTEMERAIVLHKGRVHAILGAGEHWMARRDVTERHALHDPALTSTFADAVRRERPDLWELHVTALEAAPGEIVVVLRDGRPFTVMKPETRRTL